MVNKKPQWKKTFAKVMKFFKRDYHHVAVIRLHGIISPQQKMKDSLNIDSLGSVIEKAFTLNRVKAVVLDINSPGGSPAQSSLIAKRIKNLSEEKRVPVFAFVQDVAASGGYWLACAGEKIIVDQTSLIGSIGVISSSFGFQDLIKKMGIERRVTTSGESKSLLDPFEKQRKQDVDFLKSLQGSIHQSFIDHVKLARAGKLDESNKDIFSGLVWTGAQACEMGLADEIGDYYSYFKAKFKKKLKLTVVNPEKKKSSFLKLFSRSRLASEIGEVIDQYQSREMWSRFD